MCESADDLREELYSEIAVLRDELHSVAKTLEAALRIIGGNGGQPHHVAEQIRELLEGS